MKVYVVMGETGEYSDRRVWVSKVTTEERRAKELVLRCEIHASKILIARTGHYDLTQSLMENGPDENIQPATYTGYTYFYESAEMEGSKDDKG